METKGDAKDLSFALTTVTTINMMFASICQWRWLAILGIRKRIGQFKLMLN
jgi:hypothetical protein